MTDPIERHKAVMEFIAMLGHDILQELGPKFTCLECEKFAKFLEAYDEPDMARELRIAHSLTDEAGDMPEHLALAMEVENEREGLGDERTDDDNY